MLCVALSALRSAAQSMSRRAEEVRLRVSGAVSNAAGKVVQKPEISAGPRAVGFAPMVLAGGGVGDTHKLDNAYPLGAGKLVVGTRERPMGLFRRFFVRQAGKWESSSCLAYVPCADVQMGLFRRFRRATRRGQPPKGAGIRQVGLCKRGDSCA